MKGNLTFQWSETSNDDRVTPVPDSLTPVPDVSTLNNEGLQNSGECRVD